MKSVELFAGVGGLALATHRAGFNHEAVVEWSAAACNTLRKNKQRGLAPVASWDIHEQDVRRFDYSALGMGIDLVAGGPPCQPFSLGGKHKGVDDKRDMFPAAASAVRQLQPRAFIFENVKGLLRKQFAAYFEYVILRLSYPEVTIEEGEAWEAHLGRLEAERGSGGASRLRYDVAYKVLDAADYGVPQRRHRVFIVGFRSDLNADWHFPEPTHSQDALLHSQWVTGDYWDEHRVPPAERPEISKMKRKRVERLRSAIFDPTELRWRTVRDAIRDLPDPEQGPGGALNHVYNPGARSYPGHTGSPLDEPSKALKAGDHGVPGGENMMRFVDGRVRYFTVRESARIQTFPDDFHFEGAWTVGMRGLGNAVPVDLGHAVASSVADTLREA